MSSLRDGKNTLAKRRYLMGAGRPKKKIDEEQVIKLAAINCSYAEMASVLDCNESTLTRNFAQAIKKGRDQGRMSLKRKQYEVAMGGNTTMLIWLGKQILGQAENPIGQDEIEIPKPLYAVVTSKPDATSA
jgi:DNA-binding CsgD family transcriptional regulator